MQDPLPAVTEAETSGETAAIFADFRALLGVSTVNLIWRHLATIPGALPWAWAALRPAYADGRLAAAAAALAIPPLPLAPIAPAAWTAAGLDQAARDGIAAVETAYGRTNPLAMLALTALLAPPGAAAHVASMASVLTTSLHGSGVEWSAVTVHAARPTHAAAARAAKPARSHAPLAHAPQPRERSGVP